MLTKYVYYAQHHRSWSSRFWTSTRCITQKTWTYLASVKAFPYLKSTGLLAAKILPHKMPLACQTRVNVRVFTIPTNILFGLMLQMKNQRKTQMVWSWNASAVMVLTTRLTERLCLMYNVSIQLLRIARKFLPIMWCHCTYSELQTYCDRFDARSVVLLLFYITQILRVRQ